MNEEPYIEFVTDGVVTGRMSKKELDALVEKRVKEKLDNENTLKHEQHYTYFDAEDTSYFVLRSEGYSIKDVLSLVKKGYEEDENLDDYSRRGIYEDYSRRDFFEDYSRQREYDIKNCHDFNFLNIFLEKIHEITTANRYVTLEIHHQYSFILSNIGTFTYGTPYRATEDEIRDYHQLAPYYIYKIFVEALCYATKHDESELNNLSFSYDAIFNLTCLAKRLIEDFYNLNEERFIYIRLSYH